MMVKIFLMGRRLAIFLNGAAKYFVIKGEKCIGGNYQKNLLVFVCMDMAHRKMKQFSKW